MGNREEGACAVSQGSACPHNAGRTIQATYVLGMVAEDGGVGQYSRLIYAAKMPDPLEALGPSRTIVGIGWRLARKVFIAPKCGDVEVAGQFGNPDPNKQFVGDCVPFVDFVGDFVGLVVVESQVVARGRLEAPKAEIGN